jgi:hypothetical protein
MRSFVRLTPVLLALAALSYTPHGAPAQGPQTETVPKEVLVLLDDLSDIDKLRVLNPLKLTEDQLGKIVDVINKARATYLQKVTAVTVPPIRDMAKEIKELRKKLLTGGDVPADFDKRVKKIQDDYVTRRETEVTNALKSLSTSIKSILTSSQYEKAISLAKNFTKQDGKPTLKGTDEQFFNFYVKGVFIDYAGIVALLEDMKKAVASRMRTA